MKDLYLVLIRVAGTADKLFTLLQVMANDDNLSSEDYYELHRLIIKKTEQVRGVPAILVS